MDGCASSLKMCKLYCVMKTVAYYALLICDLVKNIVKRVCTMLQNTIYLKYLTFFLNILQHEIFCKFMTT